MTVELTNLELMEVSLVDRGDDPLAKVAIFKRKPEGDTMKEETNLEVDMTDQVDKSADMDLDDDKEELMDEEKMCGDGEKKPARKSYKAEAEALTEELAKAQEKVVELEKALEAKEEVEKREELIDFDGEMIAKSAIPAPVLKKLEEVEKARQAEEIRKKAREVLPNFKGTEDQRGKLLKSIEGVDEYDAILEALLAADALFASAFAEVGKADASGDFGSAEDKLEGMAKAYAAENGTTFEKGYAAVIKTAEGKALFKEINKK